MKSLITVMKWNVTATAISGIALDWVDNYYGMNSGDSGDLVNICSDPLRKAQV